MKKPLIPFKMMPSSWGLRGKPYEEAEAHYSLTGIELERRLAELNHTGKELQIALADIDHAHQVLDEYGWLKRRIEINFEEGKDRQVELIKLDQTFNKIEKREAEKKIADLLNEPWVAIVDEGLDPHAGPSGFYFVFDWNDAWIAMLRHYGYEGSSEDELMEKWFGDVCRNEVINSAPVPFNSSVVYD